jgi:hypothetical protein
VVGVVPDEDDDGQGAEQAYQRTTQQPPQQQSAPREAPQQVQVVSVAEEINQKDEAGTPRFSPQEKKALAAEWKKRFEFTTQQVPVHMVEKARTLISSFEGTDSSATSESPPEPNPQERSDEGAGDRTAQQAIDDLVSMFVGSPLGISKQSARARTKEVWEASGYDKQENVNPEEWAVLAKMAQLKIDELSKAES